MNAVTDAPAVRFQGVRKSFGDFEAVRGMTFDVPHGAMFGILGSNGAGKTTSIRMLMNIFRPDQGSIEVLGAPMSGALRPRLGYLPEERGLYKKMRVVELLKFFGRIKGRDDAYLLPRIDRWLEAMGLAGWRDRKVEELSKGMSQKLQFVSTVVHGPDLLVLDEPFAGLDPVNRDVLRDAVLALHGEGMTIVFSTHVMEQAEQLVQQLILLHRGEVRVSGSLDEVRASEGRRAVYLRMRLREGRDLDDLPGVRAVALRGANEAELELEDRVTPDTVLEALIERARVDHFECKDPSLHEIFKRVASQDDAP